VGFVASVKAVAYREAVWFRRFLADYAIAWIMPLLFALGMIFLPASVSGVSNVVSRLSSFVGHHLSLEQAIVFSVCLSSVVTVVAVVVGDMSQTIISEVKMLGALDMVLMSTSVTTYFAAVAVVRPVILTLASTLYLLPPLAMIDGVDGLAIYVQCLAALLVSGIALGIYTTAISLPIAFFTRVSRPWILANLLVPAILAGTGIYIPVSMVPAILRLIASSSPSIEMCRTLQIIAIYSSLGRALHELGLIAALLAIYVAIACGVGHVCDVGARK